MKTHAAPPLRVTFVYEYAHRTDDWMMSSLIESLRARIPRLKAKYLHGVFTTYRPGGMHPQRLINLLWVYLRVAAHLVFSKPDAVLVRTTPPGVQLWAVWWAKFRSVPVFCWLMDYHPELEARLLEKRGHKGAARWLRRIDAGLMPRFAGIITLDHAMSQLAQKRAAKVEVWQHPTWTTSGAAALLPVDYQPGEERETLRLAYSGNLGAAHDLTTLTALLEELSRHRAVHLYVIGASPSGEDRFRRMGARFSIKVETHPRVSFTQLRELYHEWRIAAGVVLLSGDSAGLVSPSKFSGYINFGIPLVYLGPSGTNTGEVCTRFRGGFWMAENASRDEIVATATALLDARSLSAAAAGAREAAQYFSTLNSESLAELIAPRLRGLISSH